jgi:hypothetical protein
MCDTYPCLLVHYDSDQMSGGCHAPHLNTLDFQLPRYQALDYFRTCGHCLICSHQVKGSALLDQLFLAFFLPVFCNCISIDRSPHVCLPSTINPPTQAHIEATRIAIWNRNKIVMAMTIGIWGINLAFLILGMSLLLRSSPNDIK